MDTILGYPSELCTSHQWWPSARRLSTDCWWDRKDLQRRTGRAILPIGCLKLCRATHLPEGRRPLSNRGNSDGRSEIHRSSYILSGLLKAGWLIGGRNVAHGVIEAIDFADEDNPISYLWVNSEPPELVNDIHLYFSVGIAVIAVVDGLSEDLVIKRIW